MKDRYLFLCGVLAPLLFVFMTILGGALRPGYSHISDTVSELFSPGSPNKLLLDTLHTIFALLLVLFGIGILQYVRSSGRSRRLGVAGALLYSAMGAVSVATAAVFPQDAWGSPPTFAGEMHKNLSGVIGLLSILSFVFVGTWLDNSGIAPGFKIYTWITAGVSAILATIFMVSWGRPWMGLAERLAALAGFQWTFVLALVMLSDRRRAAHIL